MASIMDPFLKSRGAWTAGTPYQDGSGDLYLRDARWSNPDTTTPLVEGAAIFAAEIGPGQILGIEIGGVFAAQPPA